MSDIQSQINAKYERIADAILADPSSVERFGSSLHDVGSIGMTLDIVAHEARATIGDLTSKLAEAQAQLTAALATVEKCQHDMSCLLARIHGDGGHYESKHGTEKAIWDAHQLVANLRAMLSESKEAAKGGGE